MRAYYTDGRGSGATCDYQIWEPIAERRHGATDRRQTFDRRKPQDRNATIPSPERRSHVQNWGYYGLTASTSYVDRRQPRVRDRRQGPTAVAAGQLVQCGAEATESVRYGKPRHMVIDCCPACAVLVRQAIEPMRDYLSRSIGIDLKTARISRADWAQLTA